MAEILQIIAGVGVVGAGAYAAIRYIARRATDHYLDRQLEAFKSKLQVQAELVRHDLQKEMLKAQLGTGKAYEVGPKLLVKLRKAISAVQSPLGLTYGQDWSKYSPEDLEYALGVKAFFPSPPMPSERRELLELIVQDRREAERRLNELTRRQMISRMRRETGRALNYALLWGVFLPKPVAESALKVISRMRVASVDVEMVLEHRTVSGVNVQATTKELESVSAEIDGIEAQIRSILTPGAPQA